MNEPDTSNNRAVMESLNSDNSLQPEQPSCPFYSVVPPDNMVNNQLPLLQPAAEQSPDTPNSHSPKDTTQQDWVVEPNKEQQILIDTEFQKLLTLNEELRAANNELYEQVEHLKDNLAESEKALQWQKRRSSVAESMLNQQTQELSAAQAQIKSLFQELETAVQTVQRQENFIETYKTQLQISQQRLAQLERECALLQTNYNEQSQQALQSENTCRELRSRLMRQQRQTLQFKAALEKCLETPAPGDSSDETASNSQGTTNHQTRFSRKARSLFPNVQPIRPWSAEPDSFIDKINYPGSESAKPPSSTSHNPPPTNPSSPWNWPVKEDTPNPPQSATASEIDDFFTKPEIPSSAGSPNLDQQIDSLIQMFFTPLSVPASPPPTPENADSNQTEDPVWETWATTLEDDEPSQTLAPEINSAAEEEDETTLAESNSQTSLHSAVNESNSHSWDDDSLSSDAIDITPENYLSEISQLSEVEFSSTDLSQQLANDYANDNQSPSPVVYPQRPPKGRKSLSSVELPNFRPNNQ